MNKRPFEFEVRTVNTDDGAHHLEASCYTFEEARESARELAYVQIKRAIVVDLGELALPDGDGIAWRWDQEDAIQREEWRTCHIIAMAVRGGR